MADSDFLGTVGKVAAPLGAIAGIGYGIFQGAKARRLEARNKLPLTSVNSNILQNVALANQMARTGLSNQVYNNATTQLNQGLSAGLRQAGRMGGTTSIASILAGYGRGVNNLTAQDQQAQRQNQGVLMNQRQNLANEQLRVFNWNKANPYLRTAQRVAELRSAGTQNIFGGLGLLASAGQQVNTQQQLS